MIEAIDISKRFDTIQAVDSITTKIQENQVYGLIGSNGAGKSTFLRILCGIIKPDRGAVFIDGKTVFDQQEVKEKVFYISDDQYFFANSTPKELALYYQLYYPGFDLVRFTELTKQFGLDSNRKINTFSKGMKKQVSVIAGICANTKYLLCDETFDGLDPVMRQAVKSLFASEMSERKLTPVVASHNLRELEDICDHVGLLHKGGILFTKDLEDMRLGIHKVQAAFREECNVEEVLSALDIMKKEQRGSLYTLTVRGSEEEIMQIVSQVNPLFAEILPLSLEEIFISETEVAGYDINKLIF